MGHQPSGGGGVVGAPTYDFATFCGKLHEIENILGRSGAGGGALNPPLVKVYLNAKFSHF